jgi:phosphoribosylformylglycinamidine cyclo-ligase
MVRTFNMGLGLTLVVTPGDEGAVHQVLRARQLKSWTVGAIEKSAGEATCQVVA